MQKHSVDSRSSTAKKYRRDYLSHERRCGARETTSKRRIDEYDYDEVKRLVDETKPLRVSIPIYNEDSEEFKQVTEPPAARRPRGGKRRSSATS